MSVKKSAKSIEIASHQDVARARQAGLALAMAAGIGESDGVKFATAISELTRNVVEYAQTGTCEISVSSNGLIRRLEALVIDGGPGIDDIDRAMSEGFTTANSLGVGLPGTRRLVDEFEISSSAEGTTVRIAMVRKGGSRWKSGDATEGMAKRSYQNDPHCGDQYAILRSDQRAIVCIVDGLGHGEQAEIAAVAALDYVAEHLDSPLEDIFHGCDEAIGHTRGVAMGIAVVDLANSSIIYAGIGNTRVAVVSRNAHYLTGVNGIVGNGIAKVATEKTAFRPGDALVMWTDGLPAAIDFTRYRRALGHDAQEAAEAILDDHAVQHDDSGIVIFRNG